MLKSRIVVLKLALLGLTISCGNNDRVSSKAMSVCSYTAPAVATENSQLMDLKCAACQNSMGCESDQMVNIQVCEAGAQAKVYRVTPQDKTGKSLMPVYYINVAGKWLDSDELTAVVANAKMEYEQAIAQSAILADAMANPTTKCEQ